MQFPKRRLIALGAEFVLIVAGVLAALALDQWRAYRQDRLLERAYVQRLRSDLISDTTSFGWFRGILDTKDAVLQELLTDAPATDWSSAPDQQMSRLRYSTFFGLPPITSATFNELLSTGKVNLLRSGDLRGDLGSYYSFYSRLTNILDILPGSYRSVVWGSMPGHVEYAARQGAADVDTAELRSGLDRLRSHPQLREAINYEMYYAAGLREYLNAAHSRAVALLRSLDELYGPTVGDP